MSLVADEQVAAGVRLGVEPLRVKSERLFREKGRGRTSGVLLFNVVLEVRQGSTVEVFQCHEGGPLKHPVTGVRLGVERLRVKPESLFSCKKKTDEDRELWSIFSSKCGRLG